MDIHRALLFAPYCSWMALIMALVLGGGIIVCKGKLYCSYLLDIVYWQCSDTPFSSFFFFFFFLFRLDQLSWFLFFLFMWVNLLVLFAWVNSLVHFLLFVLIILVKLALFWLLCAVHTLSSTNLVSCLAAVGVFFLTPVFRGLFYYYYFIFYTHNAFLTFFYPLDWSTWLGDRHYPFGDTHPFDFGPYTPYHCQCRALQQVTSLALSLFELLWYRHRHW